MQNGPVFEKSEVLTRRIQASFKRYLYYRLNWKNRLTGIKGARGTGKTTLLLQRLFDLNKSQAEATYLSLDHLYFTTHSLSDTVTEFYKKGGKYLFLDEVHKYPGWALHIKNCYDLYPDLHILFAGSSIIDPGQEEGGPGQIVEMHELQGLSYREYLACTGVLSIEPIALEEILEKDMPWKNKFPPEFRPLQHFDNYLAHGYYPFQEDDNLQQLARLTVEYDMAALRDFDIRNANKMLQLLYLIAQQAPFKPNVSQLAEQSQVHRNTINSYLNFLQQAGLVRLLYPSGSNAISQKPERVYLDNTNLLQALSLQSRKLHETFFVNQLGAKHSLRYPGKGDFIADEKYVFEIGGKKRSTIRIRGTLNSYRVLEDADFANGDGIPLWLFGFLY